MPEITERATFDAGVDRVYAAFADLPGWVAILPDTLAVDVLYFDGYNQEFTMTVERPGGPEAVRGVRYLRPLHELELVQMVPPPGFARMSGRWHFEQADGGASTVTATREFELAAGGASDEAAVAVKLGQILRTNLELFRQAVESDGLA